MISACGPWSTAPNCLHHWLKSRGLLKEWQAKNMPYLLVLAAAQLMNSPPQACPHMLLQKAKR